jgi:tetratricopeptide (TPR) repeat protein
MAGLARKKRTGGKPGKMARSAAKARAHQKSASARSRSRKLSSKTKQKPAMKTEKKVKQAKHRAQEESAAAATEIRRRHDVMAPVPPPDRPPPLLRDSRTTTAALALLEKGIKLIYQKDFRKARQEFKSLLDTYPAESEILARARSYVQICDREEALQKKPVITNDQLYTLGVLDHNQGNYAMAVTHFRQSLEIHPDADYIHYSLAASLAMQGEVSGAVQSLRRAIELNEDNRVFAKNDGDFAKLHSHREFADLVGVSPSSSVNST